MLPIEEQRDNDQSVKINYAVTIQMLHHVVTFDEKVRKLTNFGNLLQFIYRH